MTPHQEHLNHHHLDYHHLGLMMGLEIHQQLEGKKLFCNCPTQIRRDKPHFEVRRRLRISAGEMGAVDVAAEHEQKKSKYFLYQGYQDTTCLLELDEQPPGKVNPDSLRVAIQVATLLNCKIVDVIQFMRKTVIDGSNTSGFQRTALIGTNGHITVNHKKIGIATVCLEEDACQAIERDKERDVYNLSRLGIPLIEIATTPEIHMPEECKEAALKIGMILRSVEGLKRGIGSIRQDVNISIAGGARTEVKGFQDVQSIPTVVKYEIDRQKKMLEQGEVIERTVRKAEEDGTTTFLRPMPGAARMYPETDVAFVYPILTDVTHIELLEEKAEKLQKLGLGKDLANAVTKMGKADKVVELVQRYKNVKASFIAETFVSTPTTIKRKEKIDVEPTDAQFEEIIAALDQGKITKDSVYDLLCDLGRKGTMNFDKYMLLSDETINHELEAILKESQGLAFNAILGKAMGKLKGKADAQKVIELLKQLTS